MSRTTKLALWQPQNTGFRFINREPSEFRQSPVDRKDYGERMFSGSVAIRHLDGEHKGARVIFRWTDHVDRLIQSVAADAMVKRLPCSRELLTNTVTDLVRHNDEPYIRCSIGSDGGVRVYARGLPPSFHICTEEIDPITRSYLGPEVTSEGLRVLVTNWRRSYPDTVTLAKSASNYQRSINAKDEAVELGYTEGALVDWTGNYLSELSVANIILVKGNRAFRPAEQSGALDSITRRTAEALLKALHNIETDPILVGPRQVEEADEILACGTAIGCIRIREMVWPAKGVAWKLTRSQEQQIVPTIDAQYIRLLQGQMPGFHPEWFLPIEQVSRAQSRA